MDNQNSRSDQTWVDSQSSAGHKAYAATGKIRTVRERHEKIRQHVLNKGYVTIDYLAGELNVQHGKPRIYPAQGSVFKRKKANSKSRRRPHSIQHITFY